LREIFFVFLQRQESREYTFIWINPFPTVPFMQGTFGVLWKGMPWREGVNSLCAETEEPTLYSKCRYSHY